ncbi:MAG: multi-sensor signal transduction histidine kinase [Verrucomicrobia bacterium]|jgi:PAS domain S-box-containing protein|nr:multi-sensor signal transduction histidine kinase [Verrucomicrobiota bacterium]
MQTNLTMALTAQAPELARFSVAVMAHAPVPMVLVIMEAGGQMVRYANPGFCRLAGKPKEQIEGKTFCETLPEKSDCERVLDQVYRTGEPGSHSELQQTKPHRISWTYTMWPVRADAGLKGIIIQVMETTHLQEETVAMNEALVLGSVRQHELTEASEKLNAQLRVEITERKQAEAALRESEERYRSLFNSIDEAFCLVEMIFDGQGRPVDYRFLEVNPSFEKQTGLREATGKRMRELAPDHEAHWFEIFGKVALSGEPVRFVNEARSLNDRWFDVYAFRMGRPESRKVAILFTNITARKRIEEALRKAKDALNQHAGNLEQEVAEQTAELRTAMDSLESLTYTMAHDLSAPIRAMRMLTTALVEDVPLDETGKDYAQRINKAAERMAELINDLLDYGELTHLEFPLMTVDLEAQVKGGLKDLEEDIQRTGARVQMQGPWPVVTANETLLEQAVANLLGNALKFVAPGVRPVIRVRAETQGPMVRLWVEDNGIGIAPEHQDKIFGVFQRLHTTEKFPGTGVGLAIVKRAAERMGGSMGVESEPGKGSRFWIELPGGVG